MRTVSGWHGKRKSSTTRLIRSMPLTPLRVASGRISWLSLKAKKDKRSLKHGNVSRTRSAWNRKIIVVEGKKKSEPISDLENLVRIILVWCGKQDLNLHEIAFTRT